MGSPLPHAAESTWLGGLGALAGATALAALGGTTGLIAGAALVVAWLALSDLSAYALGFVGLAAVLSASGDAGGALPADSVVADVLGTGLLDSAALAEPTVGAALLVATLLPLLLGPILAAGRPVLLAFATGLLAAALGAVALAPVAVGHPAWIGAGTLLVVAGLFGYAAHRYALLASGVLDGG